jgi:uncharacterized membrane protein (UPF0127 family)
MTGKVQNSECWVKNSMQGRIEKDITLTDKKSSRNKGMYWKHKNEAESNMLFEFGHNSPGVP